MKNQFAALLFCSIISLQAAQAANNTWSCMALGRESFDNNQGNAIWTPVTGSGLTELEAADSAIHNCQNQGLLSCVLVNCTEQTPKN